MMCSEQKKWTKMNSLHDDVCQIFQTIDSFGLIFNDSIHFYNSSKREFDQKLDISILTHSFRHNYTLSYLDNVHKFVFDAAHNFLYYKAGDLHHGSYGWFVFNVQTQKSTKIYNSTNKCNLDAKGIIIDNRLHLIGALEGVHHSYEPFTKEYKNVSDINFPSYTKTAIKSSNGLKVYLFDECGIENVWQYSVPVNKWYSTSISLPTALCNFAAVSVKNDKFIIIFGGVLQIESKGNINDIYVVNMETEKLVKCKIKCPVKGSVKVAVGNDKYKQELITSGFVRNLWKNKQFSDNMRYPPVYLIKLIQSYDQQDEVYLFWRHLGWRMSVDDILNNTDFDSV